MESFGWTNSKQNAVFHLIAGKGRESELIKLLKALEGASAKGFLNSARVLNIKNHSHKTCFSNARIMRMEGCYERLTALGAEPPRDITEQERTKKLIKKFWRQYETLPPGKAGSRSGRKSAEPYPQPKQVRPNQGPAWASYRRSNNSSSWDGHQNGKAHVSYSSVTKPLPGTEIWPQEPPQQSWGWPWRGQDGAVTAGWG